MMGRFGLDLEHGASRQQGCDMPGPNDGPFHYLPTYACEASNREGDEPRLRACIDMSRHVFYMSLDHQAAEAKSSDIVIRCVLVTSRQATDMSPGEDRGHLTGTRPLPVHTCGVHRAPRPSIRRRIGIIHKYGGQTAGTSKTHGAERRRGDEKVLSTT
jgi:hypothetical protein